MSTYKEFKAANLILKKYGSELRGDNYIKYVIRMTKHRIGYTEMVRRIKLFYKKIKYRNYVHYRDENGKQVYGKVSKEDYEVMKKNTIGRML